MFQLQPGHIVMYILITLDTATKNSKGVMEYPKSFCHNITQDFDDMVHRYKYLVLPPHLKQNENFCQKSQNGNVFLLCQDVLVHATIRMSMYSYQRIHCFLFVLNTLRSFHPYSTNNLYQLDKMMILTSQDRK